jgi:hypothetical protein
MGLQLLHTFWFWEQDGQCVLFWKCTSNQPLPTGYMVWLWRHQQYALYVAQPLTAIPILYNGIALCYYFHSRSRWHSNHVTCGYRPTLGTFQRPKNLSIVDLRLAISCFCRWKPAIGDHAHWPNLIRYLSHPQELRRSFRWKVMAKCFYALVLIIQWCFVLHNADSTVNLVAIITGINGLFTPITWLPACLRKDHRNVPDSHSPYF